MKTNKKKLYESIMTSIAKEVKKALNESSVSNLSKLQRQFVYAVMNDEDFTLPNGHIISLDELGDYGCGCYGFKDFLLDSGDVFDAVSEYFYGWFMNGEDDKSLQETIDESGVDITLEDFKTINKLVFNQNVQNALQKKIDYELSNKNNWW